MNEIIFMYSCQFGLVNIDLSWERYKYIYINIYIYIRLKIKPNSVRIRF